LNDALAGKQARCKCGAVVQVPAAAPETPDSSSGDFLEYALDEGTAAAPLPEGELPMANGPTLQPVPTAPKELQRKKVKIEFASGSTLRIVVLVLIAVDFVQSGIWVFPSILSASALKHLVTSFSGWMTLAGLAAHVGLLVGGIGILRGQEFGKNCAGFSAVVLLVISAIGFLMILPNLGAASGLLGVGRLIGMLIRGIAIPLAILICLFHPAWED
jgi:hypothetical protein